MFYTVIKNITHKRYTLERKKQLISMIHFQEPNQTFL